MKYDEGHTPLTHEQVDDTLTDAPAAVGHNSGRTQHGDGFQVNPARHKINPVDAAPSAIEAFNAALDSQGPYETRLRAIKQMQRRARRRPPGGKALTRAQLGVLLSICDLSTQRPKGGEDVRGTLKPPQLIFQDAGVVESQGYAALKFLVDHGYIAKLSDGNTSAVTYTPRCIAEDRAGTLPADYAKLQVELIEVLKEMGRERQRKSRSTKGAPKDVTLETTVTDACHTAFHRDVTVESSDRYNTIRCDTTDRTKEREKKDFKSENFEGEEEERESAAEAVPSVDADGAADSAPLNEAQLPGGEALVQHYHRLTRNAEECYSIDVLRGAALAMLYSEGAEASLDFWRGAVAHAVAKAPAEAPQVAARANRAAKPKRQPLNMSVDDTVDVVRFRGRRAPLPINLDDEPAPPRRGGRIMRTPLPNPGHCDH